MDNIKNKKTFIVIAIFFSIIATALINTIVYSALQTTIKIDGIGYARSQSDIRITKYNLSSIENSSISLYEEFNKYSTTSSITLPEATSTITYLVEITNYGSTEMAISEITGLPSNLKYTLQNYNLKDKICDQDNKCNNYAVKTFYLTISYLYYDSRETTFNINLTFNFKEFHPVTYDNMKVIGPTEILDGETYSHYLEGNKYFVNAIVDGKTVASANSKTTLIVNNVTTPLKISSTNTAEYNYSGNYKIFTAPVTGRYRIDLYGASGGRSYNTFNYTDQSNTQIGKGAYTSGLITLHQGEALYVYVGEEGHTPTSLKATTPSFNAGSSTVVSKDKDDIAGGGGGATDVRLTPGEWNNFDSLKSRIMVAAGGGGNNVSINSTTPVFKATNGGGPEITGTLTAWNQTWTPIVTQTQGYKFGIGQSGYESNLSGGGGGGGYYGGVAKEDASQSGRASGGTSFVSGHPNCNAISNLSTENNMVHLGTPIHYSNKYFTSSVIVSGGGDIYKNNWNNEITFSGNIGNGYAAITLDKELTTYSITYENIPGTYQNTILEGDTLSVTLPSIEDIYVFINEEQTTNYTYENNVLTIPNVIGNIKITTVYSKYVNNLESYYPLTSTLTDESTTKRYGDLITQREVIILYGDGLRVDGTGLRTQTNNHTLPDNFTIMIDFKPTATDSNWHHIWGIWSGVNSPTSYNSLSHFSNNFQIQNGQVKGETSTSPMKLNQWNRLIVTNDQNKWNLYLDGNFLVSADSQTDKKTGYFYVGENISQEGSDGEPSIVGYIKNLRIYNTNFTENEIKLLGTTK